MKSCVKEAPRLERCNDLFVRNLDCVEIWENSLKELSGGVLVSWARENARAERDEHGKEQCWDSWHNRREELGPTKHEQEVRS